MTSIQFDVAIELLRFQLFVSIFVHQIEQYQPFKGID
jgi:hypothetical protein